LGAVCLADYEMVYLDKVCWGFRDGRGVRCVAGVGLGLLFGHGDGSDDNVGQWGCRKRVARK
jgi:hypothetical protein